MGRFLITGNAGTGKSTVINELQRRGYNAFDGDELTGIHTFMDKITGALVDEPGPEGPARYTTIWQPKTFKSWLDENESVFVGGSVYNQTEFYPLFNKIIGLMLPPEVLDVRLKSRTNNPTGNDEKGRNYFVGINARVNTNLKLAGAIMIDSSLPIAIVTDKILEISQS